MAISNRIWREIRKAELIASEIGLMQYTHIPAMLEPVYQHFGYAGLTEEQKAGLSETQLSLLLTQQEQERNEFIRAKRALLCYDETTSNKLIALLNTHGIACFAYCYNMMHFVVPE